MFDLFKKKKSIKNDPVLEMLERQNEELEAIVQSMDETIEKAEASITKYENALKECGYTDDEIERIKQKSKLKVVGKSES